MCSAGLVGSLGTSLSQKKKRVTWDFKKIGSGFANKIITNEACRIFNKIVHIKE